MKIIASKNTKILRISRKEWESIGKEAGWLNTIKDMFKQDEQAPIKEDNMDLQFSANYETVMQMTSEIQRQIDNGKLVNGNQLMVELRKIKENGALQEMARDVKTLLAKYPRGSRKWKNVAQKAQSVRESINNLKSQQGIQS